MEPTPTPQQTFVFLFSLTTTTTTADDDDDRYSTTDRPSTTELTQAGTTADASRFSLPVSVFLYNRRNPTLRETSSEAESKQRVPSLLRLAYGESRERGTELGWSTERARGRTE